jgi:hypothetical protein
MNTGLWNMGSGHAAARPGMTCFAAEVDPPDSDCLLRGGAPRSAQIEWPPEPHHGQARIVVEDLDA